MVMRGRLEQAAFWASQIGRPARIHALHVQSCDRSHDDTPVGQSGSWLL